MCEDKNDWRIGWTENASRRKDDRESNQKIDATRALPLPPPPPPRTLATPLPAFSLQTLLIRIQDCLELWVGNSNVCGLLCGVRNRTWPKAHRQREYAPPPQPVPSSDSPFRFPIFFFFFPGGGVGLRGVGILPIVAVYYNVPSSKTLFLLLLWFCMGTRSRRFLVLVVGVGVVVVVW